MVTILKTESKKTSIVKFIFIISMAFILITSCDKEGIKLKEDDYLIFGHFYGMCYGDQCVQTYKLTNNNLYKDFRDRYKDTEPDFRPLGNEKFELVKNLQEAIPQKLLETDQERFGCPDCADQGGLLLEICRKGKVNTWAIDQRKSDVPAYLHDIMDTLNEAIATIND